MQDAIVLAPGPSAETYWPLVRSQFPNAPVITCNGGIRLCPNPDAYCIFENAVIKKYRREAIKLAQSGCAVWTTEDRVDQLGVDNPLTIGQDFVFQRPDRGEYWMTTGVMSVLIASLAWHPDNIHIVGIDGWPMNGPVHAPGVDETPVVIPDTFDPTMQNIVASQYLGRITNHPPFADINYFCYGRPCHPFKEGWRVRFNKLAEVEHG